MRRFCLPLLASCAVTLATSCASVPAARVCVLEPRSDWSTINEFQYAAGKHTAVYNAFAFPDGAIGFAGWGVDASGVSHWVVRHSTGGGSTWTTDDDFLYPAGTSSMATTVGVVAAGSTYVGGSSIVSRKSRWIVRRRDSGSGLWTTDEDYPPDGATDCRAHGLTVTQAGTVIALGYCYDADGNSHSLVRRRNAHGTWSDVHDHVTPQGEDGGIWALSNGHVLVSAQAQADGIGKLVLFESIDDGLTFSELKRYQHPNPKFNSHSSGTLVETAAGDLVMPFILYEGEVPNVLWRWGVLRKAANSSEWELKDEYGFESTENVAPTRVFKDLAGNIYAAGEIDKNVKNYEKTRVLVRKSSTGGLTWETYDEFQFDNRPTGIGRPLMLPSGDIVIPFSQPLPDKSWRSLITLAQCLPAPAPRRE